MPDRAADSLMAAFRTITDPRHRRGVRHPFAGLLALTFLGLLCRQGDFASIARWARRHWGQLRGPLGFTREEAPHQTTLSRAAASYSVAEMRAALARWLSASLAGSDLVAAVDGKTSKQAHDAPGHPIHVLNVFAQGARVCLADWPVGSGEGTEPEVLMGHLDELLAAYPGLKVLTGDAIFCRRPLARAIVEAGRDYVLAVKANQPDLLEASRAAFAGASADSAAVTTREKSGRVVVRRIWVDVAAGAYAGRALGFPGLKALARVDVETRAGSGSATAETRYFATSLDPARAPAGRLLALIRGHWQVEDGLHYEKDRWWDEDRHVCRRPGLAAGYTSLLTAAVSALRAAGIDAQEGSTRAAADALCWDVGRAVGLLTGPPS